MVVDRTLDLGKVFDDVKKWDNVSTKPSPEGTVYYVNDQPFAVNLGERVFLRVEKHVKEFFVEWEGIWPVHGELVGVEGWIQIGSLKKVFTGIRGLLRSAYELVASPKGVRI